MCMLVGVDKLGLGNRLAQIPGSIAARPGRTQAGVGNWLQLVE
jgi:hypothetical protein